MCIANYKDKEKRRKYVRDWYKSNKTRPSVILNSRRKVEYRRTRRHNLLVWYVDLKKSLKCERCGFKDFRALQFHHRNLNTKFQSVSGMVSKNFGKDRILEEISKCEVLCGNCHLIETYNQQSEKQKFKEFPLTAGKLPKKRLSEVPTPN